MKIFVNVARLEIGLVYSRNEAGVSMYFGHISSLLIKMSEIHVKVCNTVKNICGFL